MNQSKNLRSSVLIGIILLASTICSTAFAGSDGVSVLGVGNFGLSPCNAAPLSTTIKSRLCTDPTTGLIFSSENAGAFKKVGSITPVSPLTANGSLFASSPTTISSTAAMTNGQLLIGSTGGAPVLGTLTGTANQVIVTNSAGGITLTLPQSIATASSPTFAGLTLTSGLNITGVGGFFNAPNKFGVDVLGQITRFYASGANTTTAGSYEFHVSSSDGTVDLTAMRISTTGAVIPASDNTGSLGTTANRWALIRGVTITPGDIVMSNGVRLTETLDSIEMVFMNGRAIRFSDDGSISRGEGRVVTQQQIDEYKEWVRKGHKP